ncbi:MAG TPA: hypothetical protein VLD16_00030 [Gaiellaceae bacterium]|nr:hypothetical protein [Gaiellaceae bacterium]
MIRARLVLPALCAAAVLAPGALACPKGYSYAGLYSPSRASGIAATISLLAAPAAFGRTSHVAGWVGVGGPGLGPEGADEWLQVGLATFGGSGDGRLYYELARPGAPPQYQELASGIVPGIRVRVAVMELPYARDRWVVISPGGMSGPFYLPASHRAWAPVATAESYAETHRCNRYAYRFAGLQLAGANGTWRTMQRAETLEDPGWQLRRSGAAFSATAA